MSTKSRATIEDLYRVHGKAELVNGELVHMSPTGGLPGYAAGAIFASLTVYAERTDTGWAVPDNVGFVVNLPHRQSFSPDAAYFVGPDLDMKFVQGAPNFAAEVRSEGDYGPAAEKEMAAKRADYFAAGTAVVWDVDLQSDEVVRVYRANSPAQPTIYRRGGQAEAEPAVPGWTMPVDALFAPKRRAAKQP
jgi:Uma2 family endonuclease